MGKRELINPNAKIQIQVNGITYNQLVTLKETERETFERVIDTLIVMCYESGLIDERKVNADFIEKIYGSKDIEGVKNAT